VRAMARRAAVSVDRAALGDERSVIGIAQDVLRPGLPDGDHRGRDARSGAGEPDRRPLHGGATDQRWCGSAIMPDKPADLVRRREDDGCAVAHHAGAEDRRRALDGPLVAGISLEALIRDRYDAWSTWPPPSPAGLFFTLRK